MKNWKKEWALAVKSPIHECKIDKNIFDQGLGNVFITRILPNGEIALGVFLLDIFCLGVKDSFYNIITEEKYQIFLSKNPNEFKNIHPTCARKIIEGALNYAKGFGFKPHKNYKFSKMIFGKIDPDACPSSFEYGKEGKPLYIPGPHDNEKRKMSIINKLKQKLGPDNFKFLAISDSERNEDFEEWKNNKLKTVTYNITWDSIPNDEFDTLPNRIKDEVSKLSENKFNTKGALERIYELKEQYDDIPQFYNYLYVALSANGKREESLELLRASIDKFPDYLFLKFNLAHELMTEYKFEAIPGLFDNKFELSMHFPERDSFHISEFIGFQSVMARYYIGIGKKESAKTIYKIMNDIEPDNTHTKFIKALLYPGLI